MVVKLVLLSEYVDRIISNWKYEMNAITVSPVISGAIPIKASRKISVWYVSTYPSCSLPPGSGRGNIEKRPVGTLNNFADKK
jgi:hypothetical protein